MALELIVMVLLVRGRAGPCRRSVRTIMTPRPGVAWIDADGPQDTILSTIRGCPYPRLIVCRGTVDKVIGVVSKQDVLNQVLDGSSLDAMPTLQPPLIVPERTSDPARARSLPQDACQYCGRVG